MSTNQKDTAFPLVEPLGGASSAVNEGLTKREYFAAMAMQGLAANSVTKLLDPAEAAKGAVLFADYLIAALNKQETL